MWDGSFSFRQSHVLFKRDTSSGGKNENDGIRGRSIDVIIPQEMVIGNIGKALQDKL